MRIIEQSYEILSIPDSPLELIERAGRTCYKSEDRIAAGTSHRFAKMLKDRKHHAMLEFADMTVRFTTNRGVSHELVRHRLCSFAQESTRYVRYDGSMEFIRPVWCSDAVLGEWDDTSGWFFPNCGTDAQQAWLTACAVAEDLYRNILNLGWRPEQAREVLPNSLKTEIVMKANFREWRHIFALRCSPKAHPQMVALMKPLRDEMVAKFPEVFA